MPPPRNHVENQDNNCIYCITGFKTGSNSRKPLKLEVISVTIKSKIVENFYDKYYENQNVLPQKVCSGCKKRLSVLGTKTARKMEDPPDYPTLVASAIAVPENKRSEKGYKCPCLQCDFASYNSIVHGNAPMPIPVPSTSAPPPRPPPPRPAPPSRPPPPRPSSPAQNISVDLPPPASPPTSPPQVGFIGPAAPKKKKSMFDGMNNTEIWNELQKLTPSMREMVASDVLDDYIRKAKSLGQSMFTLSRKNGPKFKYHFIEKADGAFQIGLDVLNSLSVQLGLSTKQTLKAKNILQDHGATSQPYVREQLYALNKKAEQFFDAREMSFECPPLDDDEKNEDFVEGINVRHAIVCNDVPGYIMFMREQRQLDDDVTLQVGMDAGKGRSRKSFDYGLVF